MNNLLKHPIIIGGVTIGVGICVLAFIVRSHPPTQPKLIDPNLAYEDLEILRQQKQEDVNRLTQEYKDCITKYQQKSKCTQITDKSQIAWKEITSIQLRMSDMVMLDGYSKLCDLKPDPASDSCQKAEEITKKLADSNNYK